MLETKKSTFETNNDRCDNSAFNPNERKRLTLITVVVLDLTVVVPIEKPLIEINY